MRSLLATAALALLVLTACTPTMAQDTDTNTNTNTASGPVLVELFTSQGCSSCPPADKVLSALGSRQDVIPLAFHVDYWDYIGWKDPFASPSWSNRQRDYATAMDSTRIYTPQLVVNGRAHLVGSNRSGVDDAITEARKKAPLGELKVALEPVADKRGRLRATIAWKPAPGAAGSWSLMAALFENGLDTQVGRGENGGRKLHNDHIVRLLTRACTLEDASRPQTCEVFFEPRDGWSADHLGVAAFAQHPKSMEIRAAGVTRPR